MTTRSHMSCTNYELELELELPSERPFGASFYLCVPTRLLCALALGVEGKLLARSNFELAYADTPGITCIEMT